MICKKCGAENGDAKRTCSRCGAFLEGYTLNNVTGEYGYRGADGKFYKTEEEYRDKSLSATQSQTVNAEIEQTIQGLVNILQSTPFAIEFKVKKKPQGIKIIFEVTQEQMDGMIENAANNHKEGK